MTPTGGADGREFFPNRALTRRCRGESETRTQPLEKRRQWRCGNIIDVLRHERERETIQLKRAFTLYRTARSHDRAPFSLVADETGGSSRRKCLAANEWAEFEARRVCGPSRSPTTGEDSAAVNSEQSDELTFGMRSSIVGAGCPTWRSHGNGPRFRTSLPSTAVPRVTDHRGGRAARKKSEKHKKGDGPNEKIGTRNRARISAAPFVVRRFVRGTESDGQNCRARRTHTTRAEKTASRVFFN